MNLNKIIIGVIISAGLISVYSNCSKTKKPDPGNPPPPPTGEITAWITKGDKTALLQKQSSLLAFNPGSNSGFSIDVDSTQVFQTIDGFGYTLTGGSAFLINRLPAAQKNPLLQELFGNSTNAIGISYLRISIGASD